MPDFDPQDLQRRFDNLWDEIKKRLWPGVNELRRFRIYALVGLLGTIGSAGIAWGILTNTVSSHIDADGLHMTVAQATATAERVQKIESNQELIEAEVRHIRETVEANKKSADKAVQDVQDIKVQNAEIKGDIKLILQELKRQNNRGGG